MLITDQTSIYKHDIVLVFFFFLIHATHLNTSPLMVWLVSHIATLTTFGKTVNAINEFQNWSDIFFSVVSLLNLFFRRKWNENFSRALNLVPCMCVLWICINFVCLMSFANSYSIEIDVVIHCIFFNWSQFYRMNSSADRQSTMRCELFVLY